VGAKAKELSALAVAKLTKPGMHAVGGVAGLYLFVSGSGARSWIARVTVDGKRREMGLGGFADVSLASAREKARAARGEVQQGIDPVAKRKQARSDRRARAATQKTFKQCAVAYIEAHEDAWRNAKHRAQWPSTFETYAYPTMGSVPVHEVTPAHVLEVLIPIWKTKTATATRLRGRMEQVLAWAAAAGLRQGDNPARWDGHLDQLLAAPSKIARAQHHPALQIDDVPKFIAALRQKDGISPRALEFVILTAARSGEVRGATWAEIDLEAAVWTVPAERMKAGREHRVPLSLSALQLLKTLPRIEGSDLVFPAPRGGMLSDMALTAITRRMPFKAKDGRQCVPHGFRSSFRDWVSDRTNYPRDLAEQALAHALESKVEAAYRRGDALEKRRELMESWSAFTGKAAVLAT